MTKPLLTLILAISTFFSLHAQTVNGVPIQEIQAEHIQIVGVGKMLSTKVTIHIDFGQRDKMLNNKDTEIRDENNKAVEFNSMIDALNFMTANGYEFVQAYAFSVASGPNVYHYLMRKGKIKE